MTGSGALVLLGLACCATGCVRGCPSSRAPIHVNPNMDDQPKAGSQAESAFFYDGMTMRAPVAGTVRRGSLRDAPAIVTGRDPAGTFVAANPLGAGDELLDRGARRYEVYCQPCHDKRGLGRGILLEYGNVPTATLHDAQRRGYPDGQIFDIITHGSGLMPGYAWPLSPEDRWAVVAHVRRLQHERLAAEVADLGP